MKQLIFKGTLLMFMIGLCTNLQAAIHDMDISVLPKKEFSKSIQQEFDISATGEVGLHNKYGKIDVKTWGQNKVKIEVTVTVNAKNEEIAESVFERIDIDFTSGSDYVKAVTTIESQKKSGWGSWWGNSSNSDYQIDYEVFMPASCELDLSNKYGDSFVADLESNANVEVKYGSIRMEGVKDDLSLQLGYGNGTVIKSGNTNVIIKYGRIRLGEADDIEMESKYSKVNIEQANDVKSVSKYDVYSVGTVKDFRNQGKYDNVEITSAESVTAFSKYTDFYIENLKHSADFELSYGGATIESVDKDFSEIQIDGSYADFKVNIDSGSSYKLDAIASYAGINYPSDLDVHIEKEKGTSHEVEAYKGGENAKGRIKARLSYGGLRIR